MHQVQIFGFRGGRDEVTLSIAQLPSHRHGVTSLDRDPLNPSRDIDSSEKTFLSNAGAHTHTVNNSQCASDDQGNNDTHYAIGDQISARNCPTITTGNSGDHTHAIDGFTTRAGSGNSIENRPVFLYTGFHHESGVKFI